MGFIFIYLDTHTWILTFFILLLVCLIQHNIFLSLNCTHWACSVSVHKKLLHSFFFFFLTKWLSRISSNRLTILNITSLPLRDACVIPHGTLLLAKLRRVMSNISLRAHVRTYVISRRGIIGSG